MLIQFSDDDRKRYDLPDVVDCDFHRLSNREADLLEEQVGLAPEQWRELLAGEIAEDEHGAPLINDDTGEPRRTWPRRTLAIAMWFAARRAGAVVDWAEWDYDVWQTVLVTEPEPEADPGKDPPPPS